MSVTLSQVRIYTAYTK